MSKEEFVTVAVVVGIVSVALRGTWRGRATPSPTRSSTMPDSLEPPWRPGGRARSGSRCHRGPARLSRPIWLLSLALSGSILGVLSDHVLALLTDQDSNGSNAVTTGVVLGSASPSTALVSFSAMKPGDQVTSKLTVSSASTSASFRYALWYSSSSPNPNPNPTNADGKTLRKQLRLTIRTGDAGSPTSCSSFTGTLLYLGEFMGRNNKLVGDPAQGAQSGDRTLSPGATDTLCFRVELPLSTPNTYVNAATTAHFTVSAEQTANNT